MTDIDYNDTFITMQRIGESQYSFGVWYRITNPEALELPNEGFCGNGWQMDIDAVPSTYMIGAYSREKFSSVRIAMSISKRRGYYETPSNPVYRVSIDFWPDTRECGADRIVAMNTTDPTHIDPRMFKYVEDVLTKSGAVVDIKRTEAVLNELKAHRDHIENQIRFIEDELDNATETPA